MRPRIKEELALLRQAYGAIEHIAEAGEDWFYIPRYTIPAGWQIDGMPVGRLPITFLIKANYPAPPYGFLTPKGITFNNSAPGKTGNPPKQVPFPGDWLHFSWSPENWNPTSDVHEGSNLVVWCHSFYERFKEGA